MNVPAPRIWIQRSQTETSINRVSAESIWKGACEDKRSWLLKLARRKRVQLMCARNVFIAFLKYGGKNRKPIWWEPSARWYFTLLMQFYGHVLISLFQCLRYLNTIYLLMELNRGKSRQRGKSPIRFCVKGGGEGTWWQPLLVSPPVIELCKESLSSLW